MSDYSDQENTMMGIEPNTGSLHRDDPKEGLMQKIILKASELLSTRDRSSSSKFSLHGPASKHWDDFWDACRALLMYEGKIAGNERSERLSLLANIESLRNETEELQAKHVEEIEHLSLDFSAKDESLKTLERNKEASRSQLLSKEERISKLHSALEAKTDRLSEMEESHKSTVFQLKDELASKEKIIHDLEDHQKTLTTQYKLKVQDNGKLHAIVAKSAQEVDPYDDQHITRLFTALEGQIAHLVRKHFPATRTKTSWKEYDNVRETDDRDYFLQAHIATVLAQTLFSPHARLFGLDEKIEEHQADFESLLREHKVPPPEIAKWRIQTIKVSGLIASEHRDFRVLQIYNELKENLKHVHRCLPELKDWKTAKSALLALCTSASDLALSLRRCRVQYEWLQEASSLAKGDFERIDNYNAGGKGPTGKIAKVLFGPVYKQVEGVPVKLRDGTVLCD